jgi:hypothetical protein
MPPALVRRGLVAAALAVAATACSLDVGNPTFTQFADPAQTSYSPGLNVVLGRMTQVVPQLYFEDSVVGTGRATRRGDSTYRGDSARAYYTLWLANGNQIDRLVAPAAPFTFIVDSTRVIQGWSRGLAGMRPGGIRKLVVGPGFGYGFQDQTRGGVTIIPANSVLVFTVQLVSADSTGPRIAP